MSIWRIAAVAALMPAVPAAADPLQDRLVAAMKANATADVAFAQTTRIERTGAAASTILTRYDPRGAANARWTLVSVDGRAPTPKERTQILKAANGTPTPSYTRLATWFGGAATRLAGAGGTVTYRFDGLPKGTLKMGSHDASANTLAEAVVNTRGPVPYVERVRLTSRAPFRMMLVARVERYVFTTHYAPLADARVFPTGTDAEIAGNLMGKSGRFVTHTRYAAAAAAAVAPAAARR